MVRVGGKKSFIDKKNSTTYNLIYRASEVPVDGEENEPERQLVDSRLGIGIGRVDEESVSAAANSSRDFRFGPNHPLAWMQVPFPPLPYLTHWHHTKHPLNTIASTLIQYPHTQCDSTASYRNHNPLPLICTRHVP